MTKQTTPAKLEERPRGEVLHPALGLRSEFDRLFDDFLALSPFRRSFLRPMSEWWSLGEDHRADVIEREDAYEVDIDVPGMAENDIEVSAAAGRLLVRGEHHEEKEEKRGDYHLCERRQGAFSRSFALPDSVDPDKIQARLRKGVLMITMPKKAGAQRQEKKIPVTTAAD